MPQIANDSAAGTVHKDHSRADRLRAKGLCPHDRAACRLAGVPPVQAGLPGVAVPAPEDPDLRQPTIDMHEPAPADGGR